MRAVSKPHRTSATLKIVNSQEWLGEGAKGFSDAGSEKRASDDAKYFCETLAPWAQKTLCTLKRPCAPSLDLPFLGVR